MLDHDPLETGQDAINFFMKYGYTKDIKFVYC